MNDTKASDIGAGEFNRALKLYLSKRGYKMKLCKTAGPDGPAGPAGNEKGVPLYGLYRCYPVRSKPLASMTMTEWRQWFLRGASIKELSQH